MLIYITTCFALLGLCFGSFANVIICRLPCGRSVVYPPSACPVCGRRLKPAELIPLISWVLLRGRCRGCYCKISAQYPAVELVCALLFAGMALRSGGAADTLPLCALMFMLLCVSVIDIHTQEIPDELLLFGGVVGILWVLMPSSLELGAPGLQDAMLGAAAGALPLFALDIATLAVLGKDGFGFGDVKLMAVCGLYLGCKSTLVSLFFGIVGGGIFGAALLLNKRAARGDYLAFGPFLAAGVVMSLFFGDMFLRILFRW